MVEFHQFNFLLHWCAARWGTTAFRTTAHGCLTRGTTTTCLLHHLRDHLYQFLDIIRCLDFYRSYRLLTTIGIDYQRASDTDL
jgi:hypothetical protein